MKKVLFSLMCLVAAICMQAAELNIFASAVSVVEEGTQVTVDYDLNAPATAVALQLLDATGAAVATYPITEAAALTKGAHSGIVVTTSAESVEGQTWAIKAEADTVRTFAEVTNDSTDAWKFYSPQGIAVNQNPESPFFGNVYVTMPSPGASDGASERTKTQKAGLYVFNSRLEALNDSAYQFGLTFEVGKREQFKRISVSRGDDKLYVNDITHKKVYIIDPNDLTKVDSTIEAAGHFTYPASLVAATTNWFLLDYPNTDAGGGALVRFNKATGAMDTLLQSPKWANGESSLAFDGRGGMWVCQYRGQLDGYPCISHVGAADTIDYLINNASEQAIKDLVTVGASYTKRGAMAVSHSGNLLALAMNKTVRVYAVTYAEGTNIPSLAILYNTPTLGTNIDGMAFDAADNLYISSASSERLYVYATPKDNNSFVTPAMSYTRKEVPVIQLNILAYAVAVDEVGTKASVSYCLNGKATSLTLQLLSAAGVVVKEYPITDAEALKKGAHNVEVITDEISEEGQTWALKAEAAANTEYVEITNNDSAAYKYYLPQGVAVNNIPSSPYFGKIYVTLPTAGASDGMSARTKTQTAGLYVYDPLLNLENEEAYQFGLTFNGTRHQFKRVKVGDDGMVYVNRQDAATCIYKIDPSNMSAIKDTITNSAFTKIAAFAVDGDVIWVLDYSDEYAVYKLQGGIATKVLANTTFINADVDMVADGRGGVWIAQNRWNADAYSVLTHIGAADSIDFKVTKTTRDASTKLQNLFPQANNISQRGTLALNSDKSILAFGGNKVVSLYAVSYDETTGVPSLDTVIWRTPVIGGNIDGIAFDAADNLYFNSASVERFYAYATPKADNSFVTPAYRQSRVDDSAPQLNIFASQVAVAAGEGNSVEVHYVLNAPAKELALIVCDASGAQVSSNAITNMAHMTKGKHQFTMNVAAMPGADQHWAIKASAKPVKEYAEITNDTTDAYKFYLSQDVEVNNIPTSPYFGQIYVNMPWPGASDGMSARTKTQKAGLYLFDAALNLENEEAYQFGLTFAASNRKQFKRVKIGDDGMIYVNRQDAATCIYKIDPKNMGAVAATITDANFSSIAAFVVNHDTIWVLDNPNTSGGGILYKYSGGHATQVLQSAAWANGDMDMVNDGRGGIWVIQHRSGWDAYAFLAHITAAGVMDLKFDNQTETADRTMFEAGAALSYRGTMAMNEAKNIMAIANNKKVSVYAVSYDPTTGVPSLDSIWRSPLIGTNIDGIAFDAADNLYFNSASTERFYVYTTPKADNSFISPATSNEMPGTVHVDSIVITPKASTDIEVGDNFSFNAAVFPANANNKKYTWSIADENIATISAKGVVTAVAKGNTMVYAVSDDNPAAIDSAVVTVIDKIWYYPNIYASALEIVPANVENQFHVAYVLNAPATGVNLIVTDTAGNQQSIALSGLEVGENGEDVNLDALAGGIYTWAIEAKAELKSDEEAILCNVGNSPTFVTPRGVAVNNNPASEYFGNVYVTESNNISDSAGLYMFDATYYTDGIMHLHHSTWGAHHFSPMRVTIGEDDDMLYISDWSDITPNIHVVDPANLDAETLVFGGTPDATGMTTSGGDSIHGSMSSCYVRGTGANRVLYTFDEDMNTGLHAKGLFQYNIGELSAPWIAKPSAVVYDNAANYEQNGNSVIIPDAFGGWWISQDRATDSKAIPALIHVSKDSVDFVSGGLLGGRTRGAIAFNKEQTMCVSAADNAIIVFLIEWDENHVPTLTKDYTISTNYGSQNSTCLYSLALDPAYNIYAVVDKKPLQVWAAIVEENKTVIDGVGTIEIVKTTGLIEMGEEEVGDIHKELENGRVVIIRNGQKYNMIGGNL